MIKQLSLRTHENDNRNAPAIGWASVQQKVSDDGHLPHNLTAAALEYPESFFAEHGKRQYTLSNESLLITESSSNVILPLKCLQPEYQVVRQRSPWFYVGLIGALFTLVLGFCTKAGFSFAVFFENPFVFAVITAVISLLCLVSSRRKVEHAFFKTITDLYAIEIARIGPDSSTSDDFVDELSQKIQQVKNEEGDETISVEPRKQSLNTASMYQIRARTVSLLITSILLLAMIGDGFYLG